MASILPDPGTTLYEALVLGGAAAGLCAASWLIAARTSPRRRLKATLERLALLADESDQRAWAERLRSLVQDVRRRPDAAAEELLGLFQGREGLARLELTHSGSAFRRPGRERREALAFARLCGELYGQALTLWHSAKTSSPLAAIDDSAPLAKLVDYGCGCEVWRSGEAYLVRYDVGSHVSCWREDRISPREAEQAVLGPEHFGRMVEALQRRLRARGADVTDGSLSPLPDPTLG